MGRIYEQCKRCGKTGQRMNGFQSNEFNETFICFHCGYCKTIRRKIEFDTKGGLIRCPPEKPRK